MKKKFYFYSLTIVLILAFAELAARLVYWIGDFVSPPLIVQSDELGWQPIPNHRLVRKFKDYENVEYHTVDKGFRVLGDIDTDKIKMLVIGDSFTHAAQVSNGDAYYDTLQKVDSRLELFVYGCNGYGTFQESLVLEKYFHWIDPAIVVWQLCGNDIIDNSHDLECASLHYNQYLRRPYYHENGIFSAYPRKGFWKYSPTIKIVRSLNVLVHLTYYLATDKPFSRACENLDDHPAYPEALESTKSHIKHALTDRDRTSFIFFAVDDTPWIGEVMADCTQRNNVSFISDVRQSLDQAEKDGLDIQGPALEGHWNPRGHQLVGETIYDFAIAEGILPPQ